MEAFQERKMRNSRLNRPLAPLEDAAAKQTVLPETGKGAVAALWALMAGLLPLFFGGVTEAALLWCETLCVSCLTLWAVSLIWQRRLPRTPAGLVIPCSFIALIGWAGALNACFQFQGYKEGFVLLSEPPLWLPSAVDSAAAVKAMQHWTLVFGVLWMLADLCSERHIRSNIRTGILLGGLAVLLIGLVQKLADARKIVPIVRKPHVILPE